MVGKGHTKEFWHNWKINNPEKEKEKSRKISESQKGLTGPLARAYGVKASLETKHKQSIAKLGKKPWNYGLTAQSSQSVLKNLLATSKTMKEKWKDKKYKKQVSETHKKHRATEETKIKMRKTAIKKYLKTKLPRQGKNEKKILDKIEKLIGYKIIRQYSVDGYFVDGYCKETNTVYEVYEQYHKKDKIAKKDRERRKYIRKNLNCKLLIINDKKLDTKIFVTTYAGNARIDKAIFELIHEGKKLEMPMMQTLPKKVLNDIFEENWRDILGSNMVLDMRDIRKTVTKRCLEVLKRTIINNAINKNDSISERHNITEME